MCLIDGDGNIFSSRLIIQGIKGGHVAAQMLADSIRKYLREQDSVYGPHFELSVYSFLNRKGLANALQREKGAFDRSCMDDFIAGFNQASERFYMVDVGHGKERADTKLRGKPLAVALLILTFLQHFWLTWPGPLPHRRSFSDVRYHFS